jgi:hypothetical protein
MNKCCFWFSCFLLICVKFLLKNFCCCHPRFSKDLFICVTDTFLTYLHITFVIRIWFFLFIFRFLCLVSLSCFSDSVWCLLHRSDDGINGPLIMCFKHKFTSIMPIKNFLLTYVSFFGFPGNPNRSSPPIKPFNQIIVTSSVLSSEVPFSFLWIFECSKIFFKISSDIKQRV